MGSSPSARLGWGIDLGSEENDWHEGKLAPLGARFHGEWGDGGDPDATYGDWRDNVLSALYIDKAARDAALDAHGATLDRENATQQERAAWVARRAEILAAYPVPVISVSYSYEFDAKALLLARSYTNADDGGSAFVDPATVAPPTDEEIGHLRTAAEDLGLAFDPADVVLLLMSEYS